MERWHGDLVVSDDRSRLDVARIHGWLCAEAYWALGRTLEQVTESLRCSHVYGVLQNGVQIALGRSITDGVTFAYLCDVFVAEGHRRRGIGRWLLDCMLADLRTRNVPQVLLATRDAHALYERAGFHPLTRPQRWLELDPTAADTT
jgi:GNAT superfamily N-acetyltransferase